MHIELRVEGITVVDGELDLRSLIERLEELEDYGLWSSAPLTFEQAKDLVSHLDVRSLELVRQIVLRGGSITWPHVKRICGIVTGSFYDFERDWLTPLCGLVLKVRGEVPSELITWIPDGPEWSSEGMKDVKFYIDGPALRSLRTVLLG